MNCFVFDIDGVITDIKEKKLKEVKIVEIIASLLEKDIPVIFITGRSLPWVQENVLPYLEKKIHDARKLDNSIIIGEFGGDVIKFEKGRESFQTSPIKLPVEAVKDAEEATKKYEDVMFVDHSKRTQFTSEVRENVDLEKEFIPKQDKLIEEYQEIVDKYNLNKEFEVHKDRLGTNIRSKKTNKASSIKLALEWLQDQEFKPDRFYVFGDSKSDLEMAEELRKQNKTFDFIYVGKKEEVEKEDLGNVHFTKNRFGKGTLEYLSSIKN